MKKEKSVAEPKTSKTSKTSKSVAEPKTSKSVAEPKTSKTSSKIKQAKKDLDNITVEDLEKMISKKGNKSKDQEYYDEYLHMFKKLQANIRVFERELKFNKSTRNVYALISMYSQQREVIADIRAISDYTENVNRIMTSLIQPLFSDITQSNLDIFYHIRKLVIEVSRDDKTQHALGRLEDLMREQGRYLQDKYETAQDKLVRIIADGKL